MISVLAQAAQDGMTDAYTTPTKLDAPNSTVSDGISPIHLNRPPELDLAALRRRVGSFSQDPAPAFDDGTTAVAPLTESDFADGFVIDRTPK